MFYEYEVHKEQQYWFRHMNPLALSFFNWFKKENFQT